VAAVLTALPFGFIHLPLAFLSEITIASVSISLAAYILLGLFLRPLIGVVLRGSRDSLLAAGLMHSIFNRTNNDNGIAAALLDGELYRLGILIAVIVLIAALALAAGRQRLSRAYRLELDANPGGWRTAVPTLDIAVGVARDLIACLRPTKGKQPYGRPDLWAIGRLFDTGNELF
jgi:hypothetical protein